MQATTDLINALRLEAEQQADHDQQKRLLTAAKSLADATMRLMEAAKVILDNKLNTIPLLHNTQCLKNGQKLLDLFLVTNGFCRLFVTNVSARNTVDF